MSPLRALCESSMVPLRALNEFCVDALRGFCVMFGSNPKLSKRSSQLSQSGKNNEKVCNSASTSSKKTFGTGKGTSRPGEGVGTSSGAVKR